MPPAGAIELELTGPGITMRLSTLQFFDNSLKGILDNQSRLFDLQKQIASGKRIETPADDPIASAQTLLVDQQVVRYQQYSNNADVAEGRLRMEEAALDGLQDAIQRVRELTVQAGSGAMAPDDRKNIAVEMKQRLEQLVALANSTDANDQFIFGGFQSGVQPIVKGNAGGYLYQGDNGQLLIKIADSIDVAVSDSGQGLFMDMDEPLNFLASPNTGNTGTVTIDRQVVIDQKKFDAFYPDGATITFDTTGATPTFTVTRTSDNAVISGGNPAAPLVNISYLPGQTIEFEGISLQISGTPANGDTIDITSLPAQKLDMFSAIENLAAGLESTQDSLELGEVISDGLNSLDNALENILNTRAQVGSRLNVIEEAQTNNENMELLGRELLSELEDLDYADAVSRLSLQSFVLEATQRTFSQINNLSLFNFIR